jgi:hypothetical protein
VLIDDFLDRLSRFDIVARLGRRGVSDGNVTVLLVALDICPAESGMSGWVLTRRIALLMMSVDDSWVVNSKEVSSRVR